jgi:hypothetical protein
VLLVDDITTRVKGELVHDVNWGNADVRDSVNLVPRED